MSLTVLFMLLFALFIASFKLVRRNLGWGQMGGRATPNIETNTLASLTLNRVHLQPTPVLAGGPPQRFNTWVTRIFIVIVLQCAALSLLSQFPGFQSPFWLGVALQGYTYGSAFLFYASGGDERQ